MQQFQNYIYSSGEEHIFNDNVLYRNTTSESYPFDPQQQLGMLPPLEYQPQEETQLLPLIAPLPQNDLADAVSRMNIQQLPLRLDIQPCISVTEPTPVHPAPSLRYVDDFIAKHESQLDFPPPVPTQEELDPNFMLNDLLFTGNTDWLSWTPMGGSPSSVVSNSFDDLSTSVEDVLSWGYPSPSLSDTNNHLAVKKTRARRVSEPPMVSPSLQEQFQPQQQEGAIRRSKSDSRRGRSNSSVSGNHVCPHPGCGKSFTRPYNLTSHMRTHTADRPFACSQCGRRFARQHDRNRHEKLHWGVKPYACNFCNKPFARMDALNRHLRVENGCQQKQQQQQLQL